MDGGSAISIEEARRYLERLEAVQALLYSEDGLPVSFARMSREEAEEASALSVQLAVFAERRLAGGSRVTIALLSENRDVVIAAWGRQALIAYTKPGYGPSIARALQGRGPSCGRCGQDLSMAMVECASCGALNPWSAEKCSGCGQPLRIRTCPRCGARVDASGQPIGLRERLAPRVHKGVSLESGG